MLRDDLLLEHDLADEVAERRRAHGPYEHLEAVLAAYAATEPGDARRAELREQLILGYLPVARNIARRHNQRGGNLEDLEQVATIGLLGAVDRFRPEYGRPFLAFAVPTITGEILRYFRDRSWSMRVSRRYKDLHVAINRAVVELSQQLNRAPRPSDIATALGLPIEEVLDGLQASQAYNAQSLDEPLGTDDGASRVDAIGDTDAGFDRFIASHALAPYVAALPSRELTILRMRFYEDLTQTQIAARLGLSQMHISRLLSATLTHLRDAVDHDHRPGRSGSVGREPDRSSSAGHGAASAARAATARPERPTVISAGDRAGCGTSAATVPRVAGPHPEGSRWPVGPPGMYPVSRRAVPGQPRRL